MRRAVSVTIEEDNLLWLKTRAAATARGNLSAVLDQLVAEARAQGRLGAAAVASVAGTVDLPEDDPDLEDAAAYVRTLVDRSVARPMLVRERSPRRRPGRTRRG
jgi:hypothetical protein